MGIYRRLDIYYVDYYANGRRKREKVGPNKKLAEAVLAKRQTQVTEKKFLDIKKNEKIKFGEMATLFIENYARINKRSWKRDQLSVDSLNRSFKGKFLYEITLLDIEGYKKKRIGEGVTVATVNRELACLRNIFNRAAEWGKFVSVPPKIKLARENNERVKYLSEGEAQKLLEMSPEPLKSIVIIALNTGMRRSEIATLKWRDIDIKEGILTLWDTKNKEKRHVPLNETAINILLKAQSGNKTEFVFVGKDLISHISSVYISHTFRKVVKKAGMPDFRFHDLRHCFASWLVMKGIDLKTVQELLGHKDFRMTLRYSHLSPDHKKMAVQILDKKEVSGFPLDTNWSQEDILANDKMMQMLEN